MDFLSYVLKSQGDGMNRTEEKWENEVSTNAFHAKAGMYTLNEDVDMKAKFAAMTRRLEELELKKCMKCKLLLKHQCNPIAMLRMEYLQLKLEESSKFFMEAKSTSVPTAAQPSQQASSLEQAIVNLSKIDNLQYSISRLTNLNTVQEKGRFPSQPHQNPKGIHEVETHEGESSQVRDVKALITLRSGPCTIKRGLNVNKKAFLTEQVSAIIQCKSPLKYKDPGCPTISVMIGGKVVEKALLDLGASVNLLPYSVYKQLGLGELKPTSITLSLADRSVKIPRGIIEDVLVQVDNFYYPVDFVVLDTDPLNGLMQLTFGNMTLELNIFYMSKKLITPKKKKVQKRRKEEILPLFNKEEAQEAEISLLEVLKRCKKAIGWQISDLKGISPLVCTHHIYMEEAKPIRQPQRRLNPHLQEVVRAEVLKLLQAVLFIPYLTALGVFQIEIDVEDQEKTTFTCPFGTYAYRRMPFGLCNAPATFQRCMLSIFSDMVERIMEVFMDDITIYGGTFEECLVNLEAVLNRCIEKTWCSTGRNAIYGAVLGQREDGKPYVIYYASKTLNEAQRNYTTTEKELLAVVFALDKFRAYLVGSFIIVFTDHSALKYLLTKQDAKARLIRWILLLQEFDLQIKDKKGVENVVADHLSRLAIAHNSHVLPINDDFPEESLMLLEKTPWYAHIANYLVTGEVPSEWKAQDRKHFFAKIHAYYWEEPFLFKYCADQIIRKCVPEEEQQGILSHCHENACGGHFASQKTAMKVLQSGFTWPSLFKDAHIMCRSCDRCQRLGS
ncbi:Retrovirus-related Pol polyprotein from transposon 17.6 [Vitis vinifera]|uniref:RNA-directed DNA polymerase n=1 Tax=Vitis vinifera TaxID=29760 RepID=A0A438C542_VITVI|nr:Retrovirus-related Pol polyprotein from transposon 17.6 [Vitis vinifera]